MWRSKFIHYLWLFPFIVIYKNYISTPKKVNWETKEITLCKLKKQRTSFRKTEFYNIHYAQ